jgi:lipid-A-disaccharide synthase-like uncharacterized protein
MMELLDKIRGMSFWLLLGFFAQILFFSRFFVQWIVSERKRASTIPVSFWYLSVAGGLLLFSYAVHIRDPVFVLGQGCGLIVYVRNLMLINRQKRKVAD